MEKTTLEKIRIARITKGYSQDYMAQQLQITQIQYSRLESGLNEISDKHLDKICSILNMQKSDLEILLNKKNS